MADSSLTFGEEPWTFRIRGKDDAARRAQRAVTPGELRDRVAAKQLAELELNLRLLKVHLRQVHERIARMEALLASTEASVADSRDRYRDSSEFDSA